MIRKSYLKLRLNRNKLLNIQNFNFRSKINAIALLGEKMITKELTLEKQLKLIKKEWDFTHARFTNQFSIYFDSLCKDNYLISGEDVDLFYYPQKRTILFLEKLIKQKIFLTEKVIFDDKKFKSLLAYNFLKDCHSDIKMTINLVNKKELGKKTFFNRLNFLIDLYELFFGDLLLSDFNWMNLKKFDDDSLFIESNKEVLYNFFNELKDFLVKKSFLDFQTTLLLNYLLIVN